MTDVDELAVLNAVYAKYFAHAPAKTGVEVKRLSAGARIEIEVIAGLRQRRQLEISDSELELV